MKKPRFSDAGVHLVMLFKRGDHWVPHTTQPIVYFAGTMHVEPMPLAKRILASYQGEDRPLLKVTHEGWDWKPGGPVRHGYIDRDAP